MLDLHPHFESHDVQCASCGADAITARDLRPSGGCVHCTCPECGEPSTDGAVCAGCQPVTTTLRWQSVQLRPGLVACDCTAPASGRHYALIDCGACHGAGVGEVRA